MNQPPVMLKDNADSHTQFTLEHRVNRLYLILAGFFICNAIVAEFVGVKIFSLEATLGLDPLDFELFGVSGLGLNLTAGVVLWPVVFVMTDIINEYFGLRRVRFLSYLAVAMILYAFVMVYFAIGLAPNDWWVSQSGLIGDTSSAVENMQAAFARVMGQGLWIIGGSVVAFLIGQLVDVIVFQGIKRRTGESKVWLRATGSTMVSQFVDSFVVLIIAFYIGADWDLVRVLAIGLVNYLYKFVVAIALTPAIYGAHHLIDSYLGEEVSSALKKEAAL